MENDTLRQEKRGDLTERPRVAGHGKPAFLLFPPTQGLGSFGDQAMLMTIIRKLKGLHEGVTIGLLNYYEEDAFLPAYFPDVVNLHLSLEGGRLNEASLRSYTEILPEYTHLILIGADVLDGFYNPYQLETFVTLAKMAKDAEKDVTLTGFSHNGSDTRGGELFRELSRYATLNVRDALSLERVRTLGAENVELVADIAFLFDHEAYPLPLETKHYCNVLRESGKQYIGININFKKNELEHMDTFAHKLIHSLNSVDKNIYTLLLITHDTRETCDQYSDTQSLAMVRDRLVDHGFSVRFPGWITTHIESKNLVSLCSLVIGNRMHLAVSALSLGIPSISFEYQGKFEGLYQFYHFEQHCIFDKNTFDPDRMKESIMFILENRDSLKSNIDSINTHMYALAEKNFALIDAH